jgi:hypothetical protein
MDTFNKYGLSYYSIMDASDEILDKFFEDATRDELISWLSWNDKNGVYNDKDHLNEFDCIMTKEDGIENMKNQILPNRDTSMK